MHPGWKDGRWITVKQAILETLSSKRDWMSIPELTESIGANYNTVRGAVGWFVRDGTLESRGKKGRTKRGRRKVTWVRLKT